MSVPNEQAHQHITVSSIHKGTVSQFGGVNLSTLHGQHAKIPWEHFRSGTLHLFRKTFFATSV